MIYFEGFFLNLTYGNITKHAGMSAVKEKFEIISVNLRRSQRNMKCQHNCVFVMNKIETKAPTILRLSHSDKHNSSSARVETTRTQRLASHTSMRTKNLTKQ